MNAREQAFEPIVGYKCGRCNSTWDTESEARDCCFGWVCGECGCLHEDEAEAEKCCKEDEDD